MNPIGQLSIACQAPFSIFKIKQNTTLLLLVYLILNGIIFGAFGFYLIRHEEALKQLVMDYILPSSWHSISEWLINFFFESQTKIVLVGMITSGSLIIASAFLFPLKELCSSFFERDINPETDRDTEFPLWLQALEEIKLLLVYVTAQSVIFAIGYYPYQWSSWLSSALSIIFLCFTFGIDFISPTLQRRRYKYSVILRYLFKNLPATFIFGALFSLPVMFFGQQLLAQTEVELTRLTTYLLAVNLAFLTLAIPAGTFVAVKLLSAKPPNEEPAPRLRKSLYGTLAIALISSGTLHYLVASSMHHKSQILKCEYSIDWSSFDYAMPSLGDFIKGKQPAKLTFNLEIYNPTAFDLHIENSVLLIKKEGRLLNQTQIREFKVASGDTVTQPMKFETVFDINAIDQWRDIKKDWSIQLEIELLPKLPFMIQLVGDPGM